MTTYHHTEIATGESNNPSSVNTRLSALDSAIGNLGNYSSAAAWLSALGTVTGGTVTLVNGTQSSGATTLTVDSTSGFVTGGYVGYVTSGGDYEERQITVASGTTLTVSATGGEIADNTPIYMVPTSLRSAATNINYGNSVVPNIVQTMKWVAGGVYYAEAYGFSTTATGAENKTALEAAIDAADTAGGGIVQMPAGTFALAADTEIGQCRRVWLRGAGKNATLLEASSGGTRFLDFRGTTRQVQHCVLSDFAVSASGETFTEAIIGMNNTTNTIFYNLLFETPAANDTIYVTNAWIMEFNSVHIVDTSGTGIYLDHITTSVNAITLRDCVIFNRHGSAYENLGTAIRTSANGVKIDNCTIEYMDNAIRVDGRLTNIRGAHHEFNNVDVVYGVTTNPGVINIDNCFFYKFKEETIQLDTYAPDVLNVRGCSFFEDSDSRPSSGRTMTLSAQDGVFEGNNLDSLNTTDLVYGIRTIDCGMRIYHNDIVSTGTRGRRRNYEVTSNLWKVSGRVGAIATASPGTALFKIPLSVDFGGRIMVQQFVSSTNAPIDAQYITRPSSTSPVLFADGAQGNLGTALGLNYELHFTGDYAKSYISSSYTDLTNTLDGNAGTNNAVSLTTSDYLYIGDAATFSEIAFDIGTTPNAVAATMAAEYWDGSAWTAVTITDNTVSGGKTLAVDATMTFAPKSDWATTTVDSDSAYWIRLQPSANLTASVNINEIKIGTGELRVYGTYAGTVFAYSAELMLNKEDQTNVLPFSLLR